MARKHALLRTHFPALLQDPDLLRHIAESADNFFVPVDEREDRVRDACLPTELHDQLLRAAQVVPRDARIQVVDGLELEPAVEEVQPGRAVDIHGGAEHPLREGLVDAQVGRRHGEVGQCDLHVQRGGDHVGDQDEKDPVAPVGDGAVDHAVAEPDPEKGLAGEFEPAVPPGWAFLGGLAQEKVLPAEAVKVEAAEEEDWVVEVVLVFQQELGSCVELHDALVVGAAQVGEETVRDGEERHVLDIRVVFSRVCHNVMNIVIAFPPSQAETPEEVRDDDANNRVDMEVVCDAHMTSIMGSKHKLMPEATQEEARRAIPPQTEEEVREGCKQCITAALDEITEVIAVVQSFCTNPLIQSAILLPDAFLSGSI